jgi:hypothetical protein
MRHVLGLASLPLTLEPFAMSSHSAFVLLGLVVACGGRDAPAPDSSRALAPPPVAPAPTVADTAAPASRWVVTARGIGPVLAGVSLAALDTTLGESVRATYGAGSSCAYVHPTALPKGVLVMVERDTVVRVDVRARGVLTEEGAGVGDSEASVLKRYEGRVRVTPHKYTGPTGHYLTVTALPDTAHLVVFETDGRSVVTYRAGRRPAVELVEGCS